jgi:hypothetical protein
LAGITLNRRNCEGGSLRRNADEKKGFEHLQLLRFGPLLLTFFSPFTGISYDDA